MDRRSVIAVHLFVQLIGSSRFAHLQGHPILLTMWETILILFFISKLRAKLSQIIIYLGEYDTKDLDKTEILPKETLGVVERKIHPQFKYMLTQPDRYI